MNIPSDLRYTKDHEWVKVSGRTARIGITDYAQDALGDVVFVELPQINASFSPGESISEVESTKSVSEIYTPLAGTVSAVNTALEETPELINSDPYGDGWLCELEIGDASSADSLLDAAAYRALVEN
ncbi:MAG: glycine cleavage system protein GcvH [Ilumatobacteraceae bacterium]